MCQFVYERLDRSAKHDKQPETAVALEIDPETRDEPSYRGGNFVCAGG